MVPMTSSKRSLSGDEELELETGDLKRPCTDENNILRATAKMYSQFPYKIPKLKKVMVLDNQISDSETKENDSDVTTPPQPVSPDPDSLAKPDSSVRVEQKSAGQSEAAAGRLSEASSRVSSPAQPRCGTCDGCTRTEDCGQCSRCSQGKRPCYQRTCWTRKRENERRAAQRRAQLKKYGTTGPSLAGSPAPAPPTREDNPGRSETEKQDPSPPTSTPAPTEEEPSLSTSTETEKVPPASTSTPAQPPSARSRRRKTEAKSEDSEWSSRVETGEKKARPKKENPKRFATCKQCSVCKAPDCGECESCIMWRDHKENIRLGRLHCIGKTCPNPISLFGAKVTGAGTKVEVCQAEQEDSVCPVKLKKGVVVDFRCGFCRYLPRPGSANRSELYRHYSLYHYKDDLIKEFGRPNVCPICRAGSTGSSMISHIGQVHNEVEKYLLDHLKIPSWVQGKGGGRHCRRSKMKVVRKLKTVCEFPEIPEGFNPITRRVETDEEPYSNVIAEIDGFKIVVQHEDDEPLHISRDPEEKVVMPDYTGKSATCNICEQFHQDIVEAVIHIHSAHSIRGGNQTVGLDADRLLKSGYLTLTDGERERDVDTSEESQNKLTERASNRQNIVDVFKSQVSPGTL